MQSYLVKTNRPNLKTETIAQITGIPLKDIHPEINLLTVDPETGKSIGIDEIRQAFLWLNVNKIGYSAKILQINHAEQMTNEAQNSFLKLLEEPGDQNQIILVSSLPDRLLPTVLSRCRIVSLNGDEDDSKPTEEEIGLISQIFSQTPIASFTTIETAGIIKDRHHAKKFLLNIIYCCRHHVFSDKLPVKFDHFKCAAIIRESLKAIDMIEANTNSRLVIETFLLDLPHGH